MKLRYKMVIAGTIACFGLFYMSGAPLERGWGLWGAGVSSIMVLLFLFAVGIGLERGSEKKANDDEW